jgi:hypothetical protein
MNFVVSFPQSDAETLEPEVDQLVLWNQRSQRAIDHCREELTAITKCVVLSPPTIRKTIGSDPKTTFASHGSWPNACSNPAGAGGTFLSCSFRRPHPIQATNTACCPKWSFCIFFLVPKQRILPLGTFEYRSNPFGLQ